MKLENDAPICAACAREKRWMLWDSMITWWRDKCAACGQEANVCAVRDYSNPVNSFGWD